MIAAFDTGYSGDKARTVGLVFEHWTATAPFKVYAGINDHVAEYIPGEFYRRELPGILDLWQRIDAGPVEAIVIDGFVYLDDEGRPGLGAHLYRQLGEKIPVIGVAKSYFVAVQNAKRSLLRGGSRRPLYITAAGIDVDNATEYIRSMAGRFRIPDLLKELDRMTKQV
jgi:exodeoxyribonuclease-5/deoxyribonuclease V